MVQEAVLMWSCQSSAFDARVGGVVGSEWVEWEDPFTPHIHKHFNSTTITARLLWWVKHTHAHTCTQTNTSFNNSAITSPSLSVVGCKVREGFYIKEVQIKGSLPILTCTQ